jgi:hypothetical protein
MNLYVLLYDKSEHVWNLRRDDGSVLAVIGPCDFAEAVRTCEQLWPDGKLKNITQVRA